MLGKKHVIIDGYTIVAIKVTGLEIGSILCLKAKNKTICVVNNTVSV